MIDIKSLRIGSHVAICGGERVTVTAIRSNGIVTTTLGDMDEKNLTPIFITPELLTELGFKKEDGFMRLWNKDDNGRFSYIEFSAIGDKWRLYPSGTDGSSIVVRYLHEAELFLGLYDIELIKE